MSEIVSNLLVLWRTMCRLYQDVHENPVTMNISCGPGQGASELTQTTYQYWASFKEITNPKFSSDSDKMDLVKEKTHLRYQIKAQ